MPDRYVFEETGVGCEAHDDPTCLCDVTIELPTTIRYTFRDVAHSPLAVALCKRHDDKITFEGWASFIIAINDERIRIDAATLADRMSQIRADDALPKKPGSDGRTLTHKLYTAILEFGLGTRSAAQILGTDPVALYELTAPKEWSKGGLRDIGLDGMLEVERLLLEGELGVGAICKETGAARHLVDDRAARMGIKPPIGRWAQAQRPDVKALIKRLNDEGYSARTIVADVAASLGVKVSTQHVLRERKRNA